MKNARGSILINALILVGVVAIISGAIFNQIQMTDKSSRGPRVQAAMAVIQAQVISLALQPAIYQNCDSQGSSDGKATCQVSEKGAATLQNLSRPVSGAVCPQTSGHAGTSNCGVVVQAPKGSCLSNSKCLAGQFYNSTTQTFCAEMVYQGTETAMAPVCLAQAISQSLLQGPSTSCTSAANLVAPYPNVIFKGFDSGGSPVCGSIPSCPGFDVTDSGTYISSIDKKTLQTQCASLGPPLVCAPGQVLSDIKWGNVSSNFSGPTSATCVPRRVPADKHVVVAIPPIDIPPGYKGGRGGSGPCLSGGLPVTTGSCYTRVGCCP